MLVDAGADLNRENKRGTSARDMSAKHASLQRHQPLPQSSSNSKIEASSSQVNDKMTSKLQGLAQLQRTLTQAPVLLRPWHDMLPEMVRDTSLAGTNSITRSLCLYTKPLLTHHTPTVLLPHMPCACGDGSHRTF